ncbi:hypothetical protein GCM10012275_14000 [Longimycelium tulufanense]|uniref:Uncharacterized protein n=1 Tax=Longimycelium tulufanense TaxID=907463 RepID=A0A8J3C6U8_9PSEU|nr:hypothetical protein [Longimycelium tulufanense]GGM44173.1 hypothetical protein GCM10012275_14000 [Longimycelium tulufanense]
MQSMRGLTAAASSSGGFAVDSATGQKMKDALTRIQDSVDRMLGQMKVVQRRTPLGSSPIAQAVAEKNELAAGGDNESAEYVLRKYKEVLAQAVEAVEKSVSNYDNAELGNVSAVNQTCQV